MINLTKELIQRYNELKKYCRNHSLLDLVQIQDNQIIQTPNFQLVYNTNLLEYFLDLEKALEEEYKIKEIKKK